MKQNIIRNYPDRIEQLNVEAKIIGAQSQKIKLFEMLETNKIA